MQYISFVERNHCIGTKEFETHWVISFDKWELVKDMTESEIIETIIYQKINTLRLNLFWKGIAKKKIVTLTNYKSCTNNHSMFNNKEKWDDYQLETISSSFPSDLITHWMPCITARTFRRTFHRPNEYIYIYGVCKVFRVRNGKHLIDPLLMCVAIIIACSAKRRAQFTGWVAPESQTRAR